MIRLNNVLKTSLQDDLKTSSKSLEDVLKMSWRRLLKTYESGEFVGLDKDVLKMSWRRLLKTKTKDVFKMSSSRQVLAGTMLKSSLCYYNDACILVKGRTRITWAGCNAAARKVDERNKGVIFENCVPFINCKIEINNIEIDNAKDIDILMSIYDLIKYSKNYSKTSWSLWHIKEMRQMII